MGQEIDAAAIERGGGDDMLAGAEERRDGKMQRRHSARRAHRADALLERGEPLLQHRGRRIGDARVDMAGALEVEQTGRMIGVVEQVRRGLVDRDRARTRDGIGVLSGMQAQGLEGGRFRGGHGLLAEGGRKCLEDRLGASAVELRRPSAAHFGGRFSWVDCTGYRTGSDDSCHDLPHGATANLNAFGTRDLTVALR